MQNFKEIRILKVTFNLEIDFSEIALFRGAVIETTQRKNDLFHNHSPSGTIYRYPRIQYKAIGKKATLLCIEEGIEGIHDFFSTTNWKLRLKDSEKEIRVEDLKVRPYKVGLWDHMFEYSLINWLPLNQENYKKYNLTEDLTSKIQLLEKIMLSNVLSFLQGIELFIDGRIEVKIKSVDSEKIMHYKDQQMQAFNVTFRTNISMPDFIGLGKGSSSGFGTIKQIENRKNYTTNE